MLDIKFIRDNPDTIKEALKNKNTVVDIDNLLGLDEKKRACLTEVERLKQYRNDVSKKIGVLKKENKPCDELMNEMKDIGDKINEIDNEVRELTNNIDKILVWIPNVPHETSPIGKDSADNVIKRHHGEIPAFDFNPKTHWELGEKLNIIDLPRATKLSGTGFVLFKGTGALLERALINFMLDLHVTEHGFTEIFPPFLVSAACMFGTGQLPKMEADMYKVAEEDLYLIPTAEVPVTNIRRGEILEEDELPVYNVAYTPCFRREAGSYGKETRGMIRVHQFDKVELVKLVKPETSLDELEKLVANAEKVLQLLKIPYRVIELCSGDMSFAAAKCYDIEAWAPGQNAYLEVSSCSTFEDFQARRMNIRYREKATKKVRYVHTLNGSGIALARTVVAILENYQTANGKVRVPEVLRPYMRNAEWIQ